MAKVVHGLLPRETLEADRCISLRHPHTEFSSLANGAVPVSKVLRVGFK